MKLQFVEEITAGTKTIFAIAQNVEKGGKFFDELMYAEINPGVRLGRHDDMIDSVQVTWEDDWQKKEYFHDINSAKNYINENYFRHQPYINGAQFDLQ